MKKTDLPPLTNPDLIAFAQRSETNTRETYTSYGKRLQTYLETNNYNLTQITPLQLKRFIQQTGKFNGTQYEKINTAVAYKRYLIMLMKGLNRKNVAKWLLNNLKEIRAENKFKIDIDLPEIMYFFQTIKTDTTNPLCQILAYGYSIQALDGLRPGEALGHYHTDINLEQKIINIQRHETEKYHPKGMKINDPAIPLPINDISIQFYKDIPADQKTSNRVIPISYKTMRKYFNRYVKQSGLKDKNGSKLTLHKLRHFFGHYFSTNSNAVQVLQEIMRHSDVRYTLIYTKPSGRKITEEFNHTINQTIKRGKHKMSQTCPICESQLMPNGLCPNWNEHRRQAIKKINHITTTRNLP